MKNVRQLLLVYCVTLLHWLCTNFKGLHRSILDCRLPLLTALCVSVQNPDESKWTHMVDYHYHHRRISFLKQKESINCETQGKECIIAPLLPVYRWNLMLLPVLLLLCSGSLHFESGLIIFRSILIAGVPFRSELFFSASILLGPVSDEVKHVYVVFDCTALFIRIAQV